MALLAVAVICGWPAGASPLSDGYVRQIQTLLDQKLPTEAKALADSAARAVAAEEGPDTLGYADMRRLLGDAHYALKDYAGAEPHFRTALDIRRRLLGDADAATAVSASDLGFTLNGLGRLDEAEAFYRLAAEARTAALGPASPETAASWFRLARLVDRRGDHLRGALLMDQALASGRLAHGAESSTVIQWTVERAAMLHDGGEADAAEDGYRAGLRLAQTDRAANSETIVTASLGLARLLAATGREAQAETVYVRAIAEAEAAHGAAHPTIAVLAESYGRMLERGERMEPALDQYRRAVSVREAGGSLETRAGASTLMRLGSVLLALDRAAEAETVFRRTIGISETVDGAQSVPVAEALRQLGNAGRRQDRLADAERAFRRAMEIDEAVLPAGHPYLAFDFVLLANLYSSQNRMAEARPLLERGLAIMEASEAGRSSLPAVRSSLAFVLVAEGDLDGAASIMARSLDDLRKSDRGQGQVAGAAVVLAQIKLRQGFWEEAETLAAEADAMFARLAPGSREHIRVSTLRGDVALRRGHLDDALARFGGVLTALEAGYGLEHPETAMARFDLGRANFVRGDFAAAVNHLERGVALIETVADLDAASAFAVQAGGVEDQAMARAGTFDGLVKSYDRLRERDPAREAEAVSRAFLVAQRVIDSQAAQALAQMTARQAAGDGALAQLARLRQDEVGAWKQADLRLNQMLAMPEDRRDGAGIAELRARIAAREAAIAATDAELATRFPDFASLQRPSPLTIEQTRRQLRDNEVLLFFADTTRFGEAGFETYLWAIPKTGPVRWVKLDRSTGELSAGVDALRALMGVKAETRGAAALATSAGADRPAQVLRAAHALHDVIMAPVADIIAGRELVIVPSRRLAGLPFHLLVSKEPDRASTEPYADARWMALEHAMTVLPSVQALEGRSLAQSTGDRPDIYRGFANPILAGRAGDDSRARARQSCTGLVPRPMMAAAPVEAPVLSSLFRGGEADVTAVRSLEPLPDTADEACAIAATLGAGSDSILLGEQASESAVKRLSTSGQLSRARILHFATHGLVSGELKGLAEPAIVLTPPATASAEDDGLLTASEVATLSLDADWVILSACNTAAGDGGGEALSGLARAFFYAGARSLMVSHWPVASDAAVRLATRAIAEVAASPSMTRAEALRRAMETEIRAGGRRADPANWAPFIVVGG